MRNQLPDGIAVENVHRGHTRNAKHYHNHNHNHNHARNQIHKRLEGGGTAVEQATAVTTIIATVSYIQQIDVDANGSTYATQHILTNAPPDASGAAPATTTSSSPNVASSYNSGPSLISSNASAPESQSLQAVSSTSLFSTSTPSTSPSVTSTIPPIGTFASTSVSNSTTSTLISSSSSSDSSTLSNSTTLLTSSTSFSSPSFTFISTSSSSLSSSQNSFTSSSSSTTSIPSSTSLSSSSSAQTTSTAGGGSGETPSGASPSSTAGADSSSSGSSGPPTSVVVGSVIGSVAGFAFIVLLILALVKWRKRKNMLSLGNGGNEGAGSTARELPPTQPEPPTAMTQRKSIAFAVPSALAALTGISKRASQRTDRTASSTAGSERGFYRVSGRKLPSVLQTGGDGYGGGIPETNTMSMSGSSFYRDSTGHYGGPGSSFEPPVPPVGIGTDRDSGVPVMRPSPARTPVTEHGPFGVLPPPLPSLEPPRRPSQPDGLGRSHPSQDGSHASRFTEEV
ncbi:hypothetical protein HYALB_00004422 [Hymenoscyphus albidus]|uniref:Uncharacterized protein n=1 Tax=Hymenoscyphus albidus TaxID=595503 RepID=A0A9N9LJZ2_9HELO|nr:hypothetical protein HYALB_00004422 [Hymenoscyphus albidus]